MKEDVLFLHPPQLHGRSITNSGRFLLRHIWIQELNTLLEFSVKDPS